MGTQTPELEPSRWSHVIFADEFRFSLYQWDGRARVRRHVCERLVNCCIENGWKYRSLPHGMGCFPCIRQIEPGSDGWHGQPATLHWHLAQNLLPWARATFQRNLVLLHDNAIPHAARYARTFLAGKEVEVMELACWEPCYKPH